MRALRAVQVIVAIIGVVAGIALGMGGAEALQRGLTYRDDVRGITFTYPDSWTQGGATVPQNCRGCAVFGAQNTDPPQGVFVFDAELSVGCELTCYAGNNAVGFSSQMAVRAGGRDATQTEFDRTPSLGSGGSTRLYREIWTGVPGGKGLVVIAGFWPKQDIQSEIEVRAAYQLILGTFQFLAPTTTPPASQAPGVALPSTGFQPTGSEDHDALLAWTLSLWIAGGVCLSVAVRLMRRNRD